MIPASNVPSYSPVVLALREARALVAKGWCQGAAQKGSRLCSVGAIGSSTGASYWNEAACEALRKVIGSRIVDWNDAPGRTQLEVLEAFNYAIAVAAGEGT